MLSHRGCLQKKCEKLLDKNQEEMLDLMESDDLVDITKPSILTSENTIGGVLVGHSEAGFFLVSELLFLDIAAADITPGYCFAYMAFKTSIVKRNRSF